MLTEEMKRYITENPNKAQDREVLCSLCEQLFGVNDWRTIDDIWDFAAVNTNLPMKSEPKRRFTNERSDF